MNLKVNLAAPGNYGGRRDKIQYIVVHYTANDGDSDEGNGNYFHNNIVGASAHYFVDGDSITQSVPDSCVAWSVGGKKYTNCAQTGGGKWYGKCTNNNSISVELCDEVDVNGKPCPKPFVDNPKAWENFKERLVEDMTKYYETIAEVPTWAKPMVQAQIDKKCYADETALHLSDDMLRTMAILQRENQ